jgi:hypothetical protein
MSANKQSTGCRRRGCWGCLGLGVGTLFVLACLILVGPALLRGLGLFTSAETLYSGSPDRFAGEKIEEALTAAGVSEVDVLVLPIAGQEGQLAFITIDQESSAGGIVDQAEAELLLLETMQGLAAANADHDLQIERVTVNYEGEDAATLLAFTASQQAVSEYANGQINRADFLAQVEVDFSNLLNNPEIQALLEEAQP